MPNLVLYSQTKSGAHEPQPKNLSSFIDKKCVSLAHFSLCNRRNCCKSYGVNENMLLSQFIYLDFFFLFFYNKGHSSKGIKQGLQKKPVKTLLPKE